LNKRRREMERTLYFCFVNKTKKRKGGKGETKEREK
jgi:hypothetical protein